MAIIVSDVFGSIDISLRRIITKSSTEYWLMSFSFCKVEFDTVSKCIAGESAS
jgi:hypothetical protein